MGKMTRRVFIATGSALAAATVGQLGRQASAQQSRGVVNLYSARHYDTDDSLYQSFAEATGYRINLVEAEADQLIERIKSEGANSPADVLVTVDAGRLWRAQEEGILQPTRSSVLESAIPSYLREPDGHWFGLTKRARVLYYSKDRVNPADLQSYEDLVNAKWRGKILVRSSTNVYNQSLTGSILHVHGAQDTEAWVRGLVANFARPPEGNDTAQIKAVAAGQGDIAIANTYYFARLVKSTDPADQDVVNKVGIFFPNQRDRGTHINISGAGVLKNAKNREAAVRFIEHLASRQSQEIFAKGNNEYPVLSGVAVDSVVAGFGSFKEDELNAAIYGRNNAEALRIMDRGGWA
ncbi:MAG: Fe(3+) ABC transporter substrate-binding protein [Cyanobacteria bacterium J069]|nr:MAG: Fe(3+) ABC transporter substrate-binding protein [Cyanobacteria bacterium J069]